MAGKTTQAVADTSGLDRALELDEVPEPLHHILHDAIHEDASDVHFDPVGNDKAIRYRVDGVLHEKEIVPSQLRTKLVNLVKVHTGMSPDRTTRPLEGLMLLSHDGAVYDIRVSILPVLDREAIHMRFVASRRGLLALRDLGLSDSNLAMLESGVLGCTSGLVLITGPTGAGKTTTQYALATAINPEIESHPSPSRTRSSSGFRTCGRSRSTSATA